MFFFSSGNTNVSVLTDSLYRLVVNCYPPCTNVIAPFHMQLVYKNNIACVNTDTCQKQTEEVN